MHSALPGELAVVDGVAFDPSSTEDGWCGTRRPGCSQWPRERLPESFSWCYDVRWRNCGSHDDELLRAGRPTVGTEPLPAFGAGGVALRGIKSLLDCVDADGCGVPPPCSSPLSCSLPGAGHRLQRKSAELLPDQAQNNKCQPYPHAVQQIGGNPSGSVAAVKPSPGRRPAGSAGFGDLRTSSHALAWLRRTGAATGTNDALATGHKRTATVHLGIKCCDTRTFSPYLLHSVARGPTIPV